MQKTYIISIVSIFSLLIIGFVSYGQMNAIDKKIYDLEQKYPIPALTKGQMYQDFDSLYNVFEFCNPQLEARKKVTGINILSELKALRKEIDTIKNTENFILLLYRALKLSCDEHCQIGLNIWFFRYSLYKKEAKKYNNNFFACTFHYRDIIRNNIVDFLQLKYIKGQYYLMDTLILYKNPDSITIPAGVVIKTINGMSIKEYLQKYKDIQMDLRWDFENKFYYANYLKSFYGYQIKSLEYLSKGENIFVDSINKFRQEIKSFDIFDYSDSKCVKYFSKDSLLYVRCPLMNTSDIKYFKKEIPKIKGFPLKKVIIDIRGNWGGNDEVWMTILEQIINKPIETNIIYLSKINSDCARYTKSKGLKKSKKTIIPVWDTTTNYKIYSDLDKIKPSSSSLNYDGNIYIMQDEDIYSAAASLTAMSSYNDKIISMGCANNKLGGRSIEGMSFGLPNTKLIFVMNILIDNTNVKTASDIYHNDVEIPVSLPIDYYIDRNNYQGNIYSEEYLYKHDIFFKKVLEMK